MKIAAARTLAIEVPLRRPYVLSFTTLTSYRMRIVEVTLDSGVTGFGEVVALPGYGQETDSDLAETLGPACEALRGMPATDAIAHTDRMLHGAPFARSAVISAIEEAIDGPLTVAIAWPQVGVMTADDPAACVRRAAKLASAGFVTIKVKVGRAVSAEIACARALLDDNPGVRFRFDANQAYSESDAHAFVEAIGPSDAVELVEQPLAVDAWDAFARLASNAPVPLMLDESILTEADIDRAASVGASLIKLKLCKVAGRAGLLRQASLARSLGLGVVLGNGVSGPIGNLAEARAWASDESLWAGAGEANGFAKLRYPVVSPEPVLDRGELRFAGGPTALLEPARAADSVIRVDG